MRCNDDMTEQECIEVFKELLDVPCEMLIKYDSVATEEQKKALVKIRIAEDTAIKALEEIQQYRALGMTPELIEAMQGHNIAMINDLAEYQALGTVEELRVAKEFYDSINKTEDDICRLGMGCDDLRERIKQIYKQFRGKV